MTQTFTLELSPTTIIGADFVGQLSAPRKVFGGQFVVRQTFVGSGSITTVAGEIIGDRLERPVLGTEL